MKRTELIFIGLAIIAVILKMLHIPGSGILTVLSFFILSILYFFLGFALFNDIRFRSIFKKSFFRDYDALKIVGAYIAGVVLSISALGILFKFQSYPGDELFLGLGSLGVLIVLIAFLIKLIATKDHFYSKILKRVILFGSFCIFLYLLPEKTWLNWKYPNQPDYVNALLKAKADPDNQVLWEKALEEREKMLEELNK